LITLQFGGGKLPSKPSLIITCAGKLKEHIIKIKNRILLLIRRKGFIEVISGKIKAKKIAVVTRRNI